MTYRPVLPLVPKLRRHLNTISDRSDRRQERKSPKELREEAMRDRFLRVDHAGEVGADRIYAGQMAVLGKMFTVALSSNSFLV